MNEIAIFVAGVVFGFIGNMVLVYHQFGGSIAGRRVDWVREATNEFSSKNKDTGQLRDRYRYSLGVIIDDLSRTEATGYKKDNGKWPFLADKDDTWSRFNRYVRPVVDDINSYAFLGARPYRTFSRKLRQLHHLTQLCFKIEYVVMLIDAAAENPPVIEISEEGISPVDGMGGDPRLKTLENSYTELYQAWQNWRNVV